MLVLFLPNSKRAVPIMSFYGHHPVSSDKPLVIVRYQRRSDKQAAKHHGFECLIPRVASMTL